ncbi:GTP-binding protein [Clostridium nigeriense]|uniref:GTP-binding protein n=1 Tax=Clostridium nigeriense TaxID=1805470 RepID=UPI003D34BCEE
MKVKLEIVSGFLGAGKTSFINSYLNTDLFIEKETLIILLEKGISDIRRDLQNIKIIYLEEINKLKKILLKEINENKYSRVIIEFNGTLNLSIIGEIFKDKEIRKKISFYGSYYVGDSRNLDIYLKNLGEIIIPFIQSSKLIILNNLSLLDEIKQKELIKDIKDINTVAPIILFYDISNFDFDIRSSRYFKEEKIIKKFKALLVKKEEIV